jgi:hypothetical protein
MLGLDLTGPIPPERRVVIEHRDMPQRDRTQIAIYDGPFKLVRHGAAPDYRWKLHDLREDREGLVDVAASHPEVVQRLRTELEAYRARWTSPDDTLGADEGGADARGLKVLGYVE